MFFKRKKTPHTPASDETIHTGRVVLIQQAIAGLQGVNMEQLLEYKKQLDVLEKELISSNNGQEISFDLEHVLALDFNNKLEFKKVL